MSLLTVMAADAAAVAADANGAGETVTIGAATVSAFWGPADLAEPSGMVYADRAEVHVPTASLATTPERGDTLTRTADSSAWTVEAARVDAAFTRLTISKAQIPAPRGRR